VPADSCEWLVRSATYHAEHHGYAELPQDVFAPTKHVHVSALPSIVPWFNEWIKSTAIPFLRSSHSLTEDQCSTIRIQEAIVVRYDHDGPGTKGLKKHIVPYDYVLTLALSEEAEEFHGGGLWIGALGSTIGGPKGTMITWPGHLEHAELAVEEGTRFALAVYVSVGGNKSGKTPGYTIHGMQQQTQTLETQTAAE
jgi:hypothetical protein